MRRPQRAVLAIATGLLLLMIASTDPAEGIPSLTSFSEASGGKLPAPWRAVGLPGSSKPLTRFDLVRLDGHTVLQGGDTLVLSGHPTALALAEDKLLRG